MIFCWTCSGKGPTRVRAKLTQYASWNQRGSVYQTIHRRRTIHGVHPQGMERDGDAVREDYTVYAYPACPGTIGVSVGEVPRRSDRPRIARPNMGVAVL